MDWTNALAAIGLLNLIVLAWGSYRAYDLRGADRNPRTHTPGKTFIFTIPGRRWATFCIPLAKYLPVARVERIELADKASVRSALAIFGENTAARRAVEHLDADQLAGIFREWMLASSAASSKP